MILPAILETDPQKQIQRMEELVPYAKIIHIDVMDGKFVKKENLNVLKTLANYAPPVELELHLMVREPAKLFSEIRKVKRVKRVVLQIESDWWAALRKFKKYYSIGISLKPETSPAVIPYLIRDPETKIKKKRLFGFDFIQLLSVTPSSQGNPFKPEIYSRVKEVRRLFPKIPIEIDGGMNPARIQKLKNLGVRDFVVGSFLKKGDVREKMGKLRLL